MNKPIEYFWELREDGKWFDNDSGIVTDDVWTYGETEQHKHDWQPTEDWDSGVSRCDGCQMEAQCDHECDTEVYDYDHYSSNPEAPPTTTYHTCCVRCGTEFEPEEPDDYDPDA